MDVCMFRRDYHKLSPEESKRPLNLNDGTMHMLLQKHAPHPKTNVPRLDCKGKIVRHFADMCSILIPHGRRCLGKIIPLDIFLLEDQGAIYICVYYLAYSNCVRSFFDLRSGKCILPSQEIHLACPSKHCRSKIF